MVEDRGGTGLPLLLIHGNPSCREVFRQQLEGTLTERYRLIAFELPGHGQSGDAIDPQRSYTIPGLADAAVELLGHLEIAEAAVLGWSLGRHVGVEWCRSFPPCAAA